MLSGPRASPSRARIPSIVTIGTLLDCWTARSATIWNFCPLLSSPNIGPFRPASARALVDFILVENEADVAALVERGDRKHQRPARRSTRQAIFDRANDRIMPAARFGPVALDACWRSAASDMVIRHERKYPLRPSRRDRASAAPEGNRSRPRRARPGSRAAGGYRAVPSADADNGRRWPHIRAAHR